MIKTAHAHCNRLFKIAHFRGGQADRKSGEGAILGPRGPIDIQGRAQPITGLNSS
jgi:hypothetical protein